MEKKNQVLMTVLGVFALVIVTVGVSYAFFTYTRTAQNTGNITTGSLDFGFTDEVTQNVTLTNVMPISNAEGIKATTTSVNATLYEFNVAYNTTGQIDTTYDVTLINTTPAGDTGLDSSMVKYAFARKEATLTEANATVLAAGETPLVTDQTINNGETHTYQLRMWVDADLAGFNATDNTTGTVVEGNNYTTDGQTATWAHANKVASVQIRVDAEGVAQQ